MAGTRRLYHFLKTQYGLDDLRRRRLKVSLLSDLNDPFELLGFDLSNKKIRDQFENMKSKIGRHIGVLCFSRRYSNPVMWSHYAEKHKGLCIGFDVPAPRCVDVSYSGRRLVKETEEVFEKGQGSSETLAKFLSTKYASWKYEDEVRCLVDLRQTVVDGGHHFCDFSPVLKLASIIVGHGSVVSRQEISDALSETDGDVDIFKARLAFRSFRVVRQKNESLWK